jgi:hypothetical protein
MSLSMQRSSLSRATRCDAMMPAGITGLNSARKGLHVVNGASVGLKSASPTIAPSLLARKRNAANRMRMVRASASDKPWAAKNGE